MSHRVYISASTQKENIGVLNYGTEQDRMQYLADRIKFWLETQKDKFIVFRNQSGWTLEKTVNDCNNLACELFLDNHTDAGPIEKTAGDGGAEGTSAFYHIGSTNGQRLAECIYNRIAPLSPGQDRKVKPDTVLYQSGLYVLRKTIPPAALIENFFHTNETEVEDYLSRIEVYAKATAQGICDYVGEKWQEPTNVKLQTVENLINKMFEDHFLTDKELWTKVLLGKVPANPAFLQIIFNRVVNKF